MIGQASVLSPTRRPRPMGEQTTMTAMLTMALRMQMNRHSVMPISDNSKPMKPMKIRGCIAL